MSTIIVIPARMASTRLPGKPLADIAGETMIVRVWRQAMKADVGQVLVAAAEPEIVDEVLRAGGDAVLTNPDLPAGSDRVHQALERYDPQKRFNAVINHPQAGILAVGEVADRAVVSAGQLRIGSTMELALSCDHRIVYGADAARFLQRVRELLEHPALLIHETGRP